MISTLVPLSRHFNCYIRPPFDVAYSFRMKPTLDISVFEDKSETAKETPKNTRIKVQNRTSRKCERNQKIAHASKCSHEEP